MAIKLRTESREYILCKKIQLRLESFDSYTPGSTFGDHVQIIFPDDITSNFITNISGVMTILKNTNSDVTAYFNLSKVLGGTDEVRIIFVKSDIFDITKIVRQATFNATSNPFKLTLNFTDTFTCAEDDHVGEQYTLWVVREAGTTSGLIPLPTGSTQAEPSAQLEFVETSLKEV